MSHKPQAHPIEAARRLAAGLEPEEQAALAHLIDLIEEERYLLKAAWKRKHQESNLRGLRNEYLKTQVERLEAQRREDIKTIHRLCAAPPPVWRSN